MTSVNKHSTDTTRLQIPVRRLLRDDTRFPRRGEILPLVDNQDFADDRTYRLLSATSYLSDYTRAVATRARNIPRE